ncbi:SGNH/GDSL hydrolase family protein [Fusibacter sp. 3D3]|uniref:SGNH/GDSL hydrolase family protein n=1 Tax=Fusibacter sp. 3D3 TaxID=1048380 RepID=UPI0008535442|nr:SGNH/GDSL hydrolase family protein [Fusibacter sp. 3D3]GAU79220.1 rhamnogalacturonan acetylesterase [Fusibacter sp. 3D3]
MEENRMRAMARVQEKRFHFKQLTELPIYEGSTGYGCVEQSYDIIKRNVDLKDIICHNEGLVVNANKAHDFALTHSDGYLLTFEACYNFDHKGLIFRIDLEPGLYEISIRFKGLDVKPLVAISGLDPIRTRQIGYWDDARTMPKYFADCWQEDTWRYGYMNAKDHIHVEVEPTDKGQSFVIEEIIVERLIKKVETSSKPQLFLLGDSTVKNYIFEELPMNGWGQHFPKFFDLSQVDIVNYSNGGRSLKRMYVEGRFNDLLVQSNPGDYILIQSGHNDEKEEVKGHENEGHSSRFGRGATEEAYERTLETVFMPLCKQCGLNPIFVTPMTRLDGNYKAGDEVMNSFNRLKFPEIMRKVAKRHQIPLVDLNRESIVYLNAIGVYAAKAISMYLEAGESPAKMSAGSFANGNPNSSPDGTHFKEALAKQYARLVLKELYRLAPSAERVKALISWVKPEVHTLLEAGRSEAVYPEVARDCVSGTHAKYRNQIEKMVQMGAFELDEKGFFNPNEAVNVKVCLSALSQLSKHSLEIDIKGIETHYNQPIETLLVTRELLAYLMNAFYNQSIASLAPIPYFREGYAPLLAFNDVIDQDKIEPIFLDAVQSVWQLGLLRSEVDVHRGLVAHGRYFEPKRIITRALCAKYFYFMWVLMQKELKECHEI